MRIGVELNGVAGQTSSFYVAPIRNSSGISGILQYDSSSKEVTYSNTIGGDINISGSVTAPSFTGSLLGTASYATNSISASYALTASYVANASSFPFTGSRIPRIIFRTRYNLQHNYHFG